MADQYATNFDISATSPWLAIWKLSRCMKKAGWTYKASGDGTSKDTTGTATNDLWGGNADDPMADSAPAWTTAGWWCAEGCSIIKIPIAAAPSGSFLRGENVTQATTGAEGEILGVVIDSAGTVGYLVVAHRVAGSGSGPKGWQSSYVITGATSGATVTQTETNIEYVHQIVLWKGASTTLQGTMYVQCVDPVAETASRFSVLATKAGCTAAVAPGGGGTDNSFPATGSYVLLGTGGSASHFNWIGNNHTSGFGRAQIVATNATPGSGISPDGTFWVIVANPNLNSGAYGCLGFFRCDDTEDGDVDPYVGFSPSGATVYTGSRTTKVNDFAAAEIMYVSSIWTYGLMRAWRRRGLTTNDAFVEVEPMSKGRVYSGSAGIQGKFGINTPDREVVACDLQTRYVGQPVWAENANTSQKCSKGTLRWMRFMQGGSSCDTYASKKWIQVSHQNAAIVLGPYDGSTTPSFT